MDSLENIYKKYCTDGDCGTGDKGTTHSYINVYDKLLNEYRNSKINFLEIGIASGLSMLMWREYFSEDSEIHGVDITNKEHENVEFKNINLFYGDATKKETFSNDTMYDIIIDDGSHNPYDQVNSFNILKNKMNKGGLYIIEDILQYDNNKHVFLDLHPYSRFYDLRKNKNRLDDCLIIYEF